MHKNHHPLRMLHPAARTRGRFPAPHPLPAVLHAVFARLAEELVEGEFVRSPQLALLEAALFLAEEPTTIKRLATLAGTEDVRQAKALLQALNDLYDREGSAFRVQEIAGGFQLMTRPEHHHWLTRFHGTGSELNLSPAAKETLAIVAYRQPIMRADIEVIRGVSCSDVLRQLMEKNLIRIAGRDDSLGRPVLYGTTKKLLQILGLRNIRDLPRYTELREGGRSETASGGRQSPDPSQEEGEKE